MGSVALFFFLHLIYSIIPLQVIRRFARHFQTREPMPDDMLHRLCASKHLFGASEMQLQVYFTYFQILMVLLQCVTNHSSFLRHHKLLGFFMLEVFSLINISPA